MVLNANGLRSKRANLEALLLYTDPDAIIITETKIDSEIANSEILPPGYLRNRPLRHDRNSNGGGVLIAVKDCYTMTEINLTATPADIIWEEVQLRNTSSRLIIGGYYRTLSGHAVTQQEEFEASLQDLQKTTRNNDIIILGGDFNFKDVNWETDMVPPGAYE